jgi:hypothetical protein
MEKIMQVETDRMIPVARLQKELAGKLRELTMAFKIEFHTE